MTPRRKAVAALVAVWSLGVSPWVQASVRPPQGRAAPARGRPEWVRIGADAFSLARPVSAGWRFITSTSGPAGSRLDLLALSKPTGAALVVQLAEGDGSLRELAATLAQQMARDGAISVTSVQPFGSRAGEGFGFRFSVNAETAGRVAVLRMGQRILLAFGRWPMGAPPAVSDEVSSMMASLGPSSPQRRLRP